MVHYLDEGNPAVRGIAEFMAPLFIEVSCREHWYWHWHWHASVRPSPPDAAALGNPARPPPLSPRTPASPQAVVACQCDSEYTFHPPPSDSESESDSTGTES
jgi:hypothetical protein